MPVYISLLRGINVGGNKQIRMEDLRALYESLGLTDPKTLLQSGNVVFESDEMEPAALRAQIEAGIERRFGFHSDILLRTLDEWRGVISRNPSLVEQADPSKLVVMFLSETPAEDAIASLRESYTGPETFQVLGKEAYLYYPDGQGRSKLTNTLMERKLKVTGTVRNWNTIHKVLDLAERMAAS